MRAYRVGRTKKTRRLRTRAVWLGLLAGLFIVAMAMRLGGREIFAQSTPAPAPDQAQNGAPANASPATGPQTPAAGQQAPLVNHDGAADPKKSPIAEQSASLLKLANSLKAEVDKTTVDTLSVHVVRDAEEIEKLAHKMRSK